jgi:hypothetical protein
LLEGKLQRLYLCVPCLLIFAIDSGDVKESGMVEYGIDGPTLRGEESDLPVFAKRLMLL